MQKRGAPADTPLAKNITAGIARLGYTSVRAFCIDKGISYDAVRGMLRGHSKVGRSHNINRLAAAFGVRPEALLDAAAQFSEAQAALHEPTPLVPLPADDEAFGEVARLVALMLAEAALPSDPAAVATASAQVWRDAHVVGTAIPLADRIEMAISEKRSGLLRARQRRLGVHDA